MKPETARRKFVHLSKAWYAGSALSHAEYTDEINMGKYWDDGSTIGEITLRWYNVGVHNCPKLEAFEDSWKALKEFQDLIDKLSEIDGTNPSPETICNLLLSLGIEDVTPINSPYRA